MGSEPLWVSRWAKVWSCRPAGHAWLLVVSTLRPCYNEINMEQIFDKWHNKVQCPTGKSGASSIDYVNFLYVFIICWVGAALVSSSAQR